MSRVERHFDELFSIEGTKQYTFNPRSMGAKDRQIVEALGSFGVSGMSCLDIGPGTGRWLTFLRSQSPARLTTVDISEASLARCHHLCDEHHRIDIELEPLPFADATFDIIVSFEVLEHLRDPFLYLSEISRVLKRRGMLLLSTPNLASLISRFRLVLGLLPVAIAADSTHVGFYRRKDLLRLLAVHGFHTIFLATTVSLNPFNPKSRVALPAVGPLAGMEDTLLARAELF